MNFEGVSHAIRARLAGYSAFAGGLTYIGMDRPQDDAPEDASGFPYAVIDEIDARPWDTKTSDGGAQLFQVTAFCRPTSSASAHAQANTYAQAAYDALHNFDLVVNGSNVVICRFQSSPGVMEDVDGVTRYRPMIFSVIYDDEA